MLYVCISERRGRRESIAAGGRDMGALLMAVFVVVEQAAATPVKSPLLSYTLPVVSTNLVVTTLI
jgi:hypothetical protein